MLLILKLSVHKYSKYLNVILRLYDLFLNDKGFRDTLIRFTDKVDNNRLFRFKCYSASSFSVQRVVNNSFNSFFITLSRGSRNLCGEVIHEDHYFFVAINTSLHQIGIKEEEQD